ncbi:hypothetical protein [Neorhodopirellula pilleata]|uniref:Uncharacterized protein n=1 Tax=Neorhodopirellula pilleata TaxID=2714738 RepID=A0A5C6AX28_9BACT|nr:hypothetical protein [Neorhodopirellula pilleata]TWU04067.1 hypothetical protein Pla100_10030 [Neorhodopirellula pilleata]
MARMSRAEVFDPGEVAVGHVFSRTVRRCFLMGVDPVSGKNFDHRKADGSPMKPTQPEINSIAGCPIKREEIRRRLSDLSWWMRLLCQRVAMRSNREDEEHGRFFQDRYKATRFGSSLLITSAHWPNRPIVDEAGTFLIANAARPGKTQAVEASVQATLVESGM